METQPANAPARRHRKSLAAHKHFEDRGELFVLFLLAGERYGAGIDCVQEILKPRNITPIPHTPDYLAGIINLRGRIVPVVDLRRKLGMPRMPIRRNTRIMIVINQGVTLGAIVDEVIAVRSIPDKRIEPAPPIISGAVDAAISGLAKLSGDVITLLNLEQVLKQQGRETPEKEQS